MKSLQSLKPGVPRRILLFIAALAWTAAAGILFFRGGKIIIDNALPLRPVMIYVLILGILFYLVLFARISRKHSLRIFNMKIEKPCAFSFFSIRSYLLMLLMIGSGVFLRCTESVDESIIGVFYFIMGIPLLLSSFRFWYFGFRYQRVLEAFEKQDKEEQVRLPRWQRRLRNVFYVLTILILFVLVYSNWRISHYAQPYLYSNVKDIPKNVAGVVPGTSSKLGNGNTNLYFQYRVQAAADLYHAGKIEYIIISGDNGTIYYNEPQEMKNALVELGVPEKVIYPDYAGFRTFDSMIRAWKVFGQKRFTVISQEFQNERAVFIARQYEIEAIGFNAADVTKYSGFKTRLREILARVNVFLDIFILDKQPHFLGDPIIIGDSLSVARDSLSNPQTK